MLSRLLFHRQPVLYQQPEYLSLVYAGLHTFNAHFDWQSLFNSIEKQPLHKALVKSLAKISSKRYGINLLNMFNTSLTEFSRPCRIDSPYTMMPSGRSQVLDMNQENYPSYDAIILLSGGQANDLLSINSAQRVLKLLDAINHGVMAERIIISGKWSLLSQLRDEEHKFTDAELMLVYLRHLTESLHIGFPLDRVVLEQEAKDTRGNAEFSVIHLSELGITDPQRFLIITSEEHGPRSRYIFSEVSNHYPKPPHLDFLLVPSLGRIDPEMEEGLLRYEYAVTEYAPNLKILSIPPEDRREFAREWQEARKFDYIHVLGELLAEREHKGSRPEAYR